MPSTSTNLNRELMFKIIIIIIIIVMESINTSSSTLDTADTLSLLILSGLIMQRLINYAPSWPIRFHSNLAAIYILLSRKQIAVSMYMYLYLHISTYESVED